MKNTLKQVGGRKLGLVTAATSLLAAGSAMAQNAGAEAITTQVELLVPVAAAVVGAAVLVVVVPWGAKMAVKAFKAIVGG